MARDPKGRKPQIARSKNIEQVQVAALETAVEEFANYRRAMHRLADASTRAAEMLDSALNPQTIGLDGAHHDVIVYRAKFDTAVRFCRTAGLTAQEVHDALEAISKS